MTDLRKKIQAIEQRKKLKIARNGAYDVEANKVAVKEAEDELVALVVEARIEELEKFHIYDDKIGRLSKITDRLKQLQKEQAND